MKTNKPITLAERQTMKGYRKRWWLPGDEGYGERFSDDPTMTDSTTAHAAANQRKKSDPKLNG
jgi:hypothetical protein